MLYLNDVAKDARHSFRIAGTQLHREKENKKNKKKITADEKPNSLIT